MPSTHDYIDDKRNNNIQVYINGKFYHRSKANISVMDSGFLLGDGVWEGIRLYNCLLYTSPSPRDMRRSRMPSSA